MKRALLALALSMLLAHTAQAQQSASDEARHILPIRQADRPMTLPEGTFRLDQSVVLRAGSGFGLSGPNALSVGLTDWLEAGVSWPWTRDPTPFATARFGHTSVADIGVRVQATLPAVTTGDTDLVVSMPMVFRLAHIARIATAITGDFLLTQRVQPILRVPLSIVFNPSARHFLGIDASVSLVDYRFWHGGAGIYYGHTAATPLRPFGEIRFGANLEAAPGLASGTSITFSTYVAFSFWTTVNPID